MTYVTCSSAEFHVKGGKWMKDTTFVYKSGDSIDFTGDVKFTIISQDLSATRTYDIKVNVHKVKPDSLSWGLHRFQAVRKQAMQFLFQKLW